MNHYEKDFLAHVLENDGFRVDPPRRVELALLDASGNELVYPGYERQPVEFEGVQDGHSFHFTNKTPALFPQPPHAIAVHAIGLAHNGGPVLFIWDISDAGLPQVTRIGFCVGVGELHVRSADEWP